MTIVSLSSHTVTSVIMETVPQGDDCRCCLARSANLPTGLYILLALILLFFILFFNLSTTVSGSTEPIIIFHLMIGICVNDVNDPDLLKGRYHGNRFYGKILVYAFIRQSGVWKQLAISHSDSQIFNGNTLSTFCANMMKIGLVTPEITRVTNGPFWMRRQKSAYLTEYLTNY